MSLPAILQQLNNCNAPKATQNAGMVELLRGIKNPQSFIQDMVCRNNPQIKQVMDYINTNGGNAEQAFYKYANDNGIDPQTIINMMK